MKSNDDNWYDFSQVVDILGVSERTGRNLVAGIRQQLIREEMPTTGRPKKLYHFSCDPRLTTYHQSAAVEEVIEECDEIDSITPDDMATGQLRVSAVSDYLNRRKLMTEDAAAKDTCRDWSRRPREITVHVDDRLPGGHTRKKEKVVSLPQFKSATLRRWSKTYKEKKTTAALAPRRKKKQGRKRVDIPEDLLDFVHGIFVTSTRADISTAVEFAKDHWKADFPNVSLKTWQRRINGRDPSKAMVNLGKHGIGTFRDKQSPDITKDYSSMRYNQLWQLDDITEDFYGHANDPSKLVRPNVYAIIRVATRQWVCGVAVETPITQDQVRSLIGMAMASPSGGIPEEITFEQGTVACDTYLEEHLELFDIKTHDTSMDGGTATPGGFKDRAKGHAQGKGVIEANNKKHHQLLWNTLAATGPEERHTANANLETIKNIAKQRAADGKLLILPGPMQWRAMIFEAFDKHNNLPHSGLPKIADPETGKPRHATPNEFAKHINDDKGQVMDERLLPLFFKKGLKLKVTKNGFRLNGFSYGRFDEQLQELRGTLVTAFGIKECPEVAFVEELGRCVERFEEPEYGKEGDLIKQKRGIERKARNQYEEMVVNAMKNPGSVVLETIKFMNNPAAHKDAEVIAPEIMIDRIKGMNQGAEEHRKKKEISAERFKTDTPRSARRSRGKGLLAKADTAKEQVAALTDNNHNQENDKWNF